MFILGNKEEKRVTGGAVFPELLGRSTVNSLIELTVVFVRVSTKILRQS